MSFVLGCFFAMARAVMVKRPALRDIENAFLPAKEILTPDRFAGREEAVESAYYSLLAEGSNIAIVGNRGIGKTSLSRQIINMGMGDNSLAQRVGIAVDEPLDFHSVYFACGKNISSIDQLLEALLTSENCFLQSVYDIPKARQLMSSYSPKFKASAFGVGIEFGGERKESNDFTPVLAQHPIFSVFTNVMNAIAGAGQHRDGILIVIDEFDQIVDRSGFASFLKSIATNAPAVKFCIVGVAQDIVDLMREHESTDRLFAGSIIHLPPMSESELSEIFSLAEGKINNYISFGGEAKNMIIGLSQGHPYLVHLFGKYSLRETYRSGNPVVSLEDVELALEVIAEKKADPILENRYRMAVVSSNQRERVLKSLADKKGDGGEVFTGDAYKVAIDHGVDNPSHYVGQLVTDEYGAEIVKVRERYYRFKDSLFHAYVVAHPFLRGGDIDAKVD